MGCEYVMHDREGFCGEPRGHQGPREDSGVNRALVPGEDAARV